jgi:hypothetical protein
MNCPHCGIAFHENWRPFGLGIAQWVALADFCPECRRPILELAPSPGHNERFRVYPINTFRKPTPNEVPPHIKEDYEEACRVLPISPKASATLSRRCLQALLREQGYTQKNLIDQITALLGETDPKRYLPSVLHDTVDTIRNFGNFAAHPITDQTTLQLISVEPGEAEWCLDILEELFDHYYVKPIQAAARKVALNATLAAAGKPPSKP